MKRINYLKTTVLSVVAMLIVIFVSYYKKESEGFPSNSSKSAFFVLAPQSSIEITLHGQCKHITNLTKDTNAYIPMAPDTWPGFDSRKDQNARPAVEVKPCAAL